MTTSEQLILDLLGDRHARAPYPITYSTPTGSLKPKRVKKDDYVQ